MRIYLDHNATTPPAPAVLETMARVARDVWGNASSIHHYGQQAKAVDCQCTAPAAVSAAPATVEASVATPSAAISTALSASPVSAAVAPSATAATDVEQALASELEAPQP